VTAQTKSNPKTEYYLPELRGLFTQFDFNQDGLVTRVELGKMFDLLRGELKGIKPG